MVGEGGVPGIEKPGAPAGRGRQAEEDFCAAGKLSYPTSQFQEGTCPPRYQDVVSPDPGDSSITSFFESPHLFLLLTSEGCFS